MGDPVDKNERTPSIAEVIRQCVWAELADVHVGCAAVVKKYDEAKSLVDVQPQPRFPVRDAEGNVTFERLPIIADVPLGVLGAGGFRITLPIQEGDEVWLTFSDVSMDSWMERGGDVDANDVRRFHLSDAFAIPMIRPKSKAWKNAHTTKLTVGHDTGRGRVWFDKDQISLGEENPASFVALATATKNRLDSIVATFNGHTHTVPGSGLTADLSSGAVTGSATSGAGPSNNGNNGVASDTVKAR